MSNRALATRGGGGKSVVGGDEKNDKYYNNIIFYPQLLNADRTLAAAATAAPDDPVLVAKAFLDSLVVKVHKAVSTNDRSALEEILKAETDGFVVRPRTRSASRSGGEPRDGDGDGGDAPVEEAVIVAAPLSNPGFPTALEILSHPNNFGQNALHKACLAGAAGCVETLLTQGMQVGATDKYGATPLHCECRFHWPVSIQPATPSQPFPRPPPSAHPIILLHQTRAATPQRCRPSAV